MSPKGPHTPQQIRQLTRDLDEMKVLALDMAELTRAVFGADDQRTIRAGELLGAVQRMRWAIEREGRIGAAAAGE